MHVIKTKHCTIRQKIRGVPQAEDVSVGRINVGRGRLNENPSSNFVGDFSTSCSKTSGAKFEDSKADSARTVSISSGPVQH